MYFLLLVLLIVFVLAPMAQAYAKRLNPPDVPGVKPNEIARLREEVDQLAATVNRLQDEQSFMLRLLSEPREAGSLPPRTDVRDAAPPVAPRERPQEQPRDPRRPEP
jgi:hypothetical protein